MNIHMNFLPLVPVDNEHFRYFLFPDSNSTIESADYFHPFLDTGNFPGVVVCVPKQVSLPHEKLFRHRLNVTLSLITLNYLHLL